MVMWTIVVNENEMLKIVNVFGNVRLIWIVVVAKEDVYAMANVDCLVLE